VENEIACRYAEYRISLLAVGPVIMFVSLWIVCVFFSRCSKSFVGVGKQISEIRCRLLRLHRTSFYLHLLANFQLSHTYLLSCFFVVFLSST